MYAFNLEKVAQNSFIITLQGREDFDNANDHKWEFLVCDILLTKSRVAREAVHEDVLESIPIKVLIKHIP